MKSKEQRATEVQARLEYYRSLTTEQKIELVKQRITKEDGARGSGSRELSRLYSRLEEEKGTIVPSKTAAILEVEPGLGKHGRAKRT